MIDYDRFAAEYARNRRVQPDLLRALVAGGDIRPASRVLEVGCGTGNYIIALEGLTGCSCRGIDPSEEMLARARERSGAVQFQAGRAEALPWPEESFDLVFSVDAIHHVGDRPQAFLEAFRVLSPGGKVCTATDSDWIIRNRQPLATYFPDTVTVDLGRYPSLAELRDGMARGGFADLAEQQVEFSYHLTDARPYRERAFSCLRLIPEEAFRAGLERLEKDLLTGPVACVSRYVLLWGTKSPVAREG
jgi:ubiquinone/menaquinone biosynthesis C-methylase UbiE